MSDPASGPPPPPAPPLPDPPLPVEVPFWSTIVPVMLGLVLCGVTVSLLPATQYEYLVLSWVMVIVLDAVVKLPSVLGPLVTNPIVPFCLTTPVHEQPPLAESTQVAVLKYPSDMTVAILSHVTVVPERMRQAAGNSRRSVPDVVVPSVNVPLALAVQVPVT